MGQRGSKRSLKDCKIIEVVIGELKFYIFVVWCGVTSSMTDWVGPGPSFYCFSPEATKLPGLDVDCEGITPASCFIIQDHWTRYFLGCTICGTLWNDEVSCLVGGTVLTVWGWSETPFIKDEQKHPMPECSHLILTHYAIGKFIPIGLVLTLGYESMDCWHTPKILHVPFCVGPLRGCPF